MYLPTVKQGLTSDGYRNFIREVEKSTTMARTV